MNKVKEFLKLGLMLAAWAVVACLGLAAAQVFTQKAAERQAAAQTAAALKNLFPEMESDRQLSEGELPRDLGDGVSLIQAWAVLRKDSVIGIAVKAQGRSYKDKAVVLTGLDLQNRIAGVRILELSDTPGLGQNAASPSYYIDKARTTTWFGQFAGRTADDPFAVGRGKDDIQAITASTITSKSVTAIVKAQAAAAAAWLKAYAQQGGQ